MLVLGLTGPFGSGCTTIRRDYLELHHGFKAVSLSEVLGELHEERTGKRLTARREKQDAGNELRQTQGPDVLARRACEEMDSSGGPWVVDSIRNPAEVAYFRSKFSGFYLIGVYAGQAVRLNRVRSQYADEREFDRDEQRDREDEHGHGQHADACFKAADIIISNEQRILAGNHADGAMRATVGKMIDLIRRPGSRPPTMEEALMAMAYANSKRSNCYARQVGALLVDPTGNIFSSGLQRGAKV